MTLKTNPTQTNSTYRPLVSALYYAQPWETSYSRVYGIMGGRLTRRVNAAPSLEFEYMNPRGGNTELFTVGGKVKLLLDWSVTDTDLAQFIGIITPGAGISRGTGKSVSIHAVGFSSLLGKEYQLIGEYYLGSAPTTLHEETFEDFEAGVAIRKLVSNLSGSPLDISGVASSNPEKVIGRDIILPEGWSLKSALVSKIVEGMIDADESANIPRPYYWFETSDRGSDIPGFYVRKFPDLGVAPALRTLDWDDEIIDSTDNVRVDQATRCICVSSRDRTVYEVFQSDSAVERYGLLDAKIDWNSTNRDDLFKMAWRYVQSHKSPFRSISVSTPFAIDIMPLEVLQINNGPYGFEGKQAVVEVSIPFGNSPGLTEITLASQEEVITDLV